MNKERKILPGLTKCNQCGNFKGTTKYNNTAGEIEVLCACHNQLCNRCGNKIYEFKVPSAISENGTGILHVSIVCAWGHTCPDGFKSQLRNSFLIDLTTK